MKKYLLLITFTLCISNFSFAQKPINNFRSVPKQNGVTALVSLLDSLYDWHWNDSTQNWIFYEREYLFYDTSNRVVNSIVQLWQGGGWINSWQYFNTYDANDNLLNNLSQTWNGTAWVNHGQSINTYDTSNNEVSSVYQMWDTIFTLWRTKQHVSLTYDTINNLLYENDSSAINRQRFYTYDSLNNLTSALEQNWNGSSWDNYYLWLYNYDTNNNQINYTIQIWNGTTWVNGSLQLFTYDMNNNQTSWIQQAWNGTTYVNSGENLYFYDVNNNRTAHQILQWQGTSWVNFYQYLYTYDANNNNDSYLSQKWDTTITSWVNSDSIHYYYHTFFNSIVETDNQSIAIYPNPTQTSFTIELNSIAKNAQAEVYNILGEKIYSTAIMSQSQIINVQFLSGIYFVKLTNGEKQYVEKLIVQ